MTAVQIGAPAKLNLGLEVVGRRPDGYHEIRSVLAMVDLVDTLTVEPCHGSEVSRSVDLPGVSVGEDLALRALLALQRSTHTRAGARLSIQKRIPTAAGLGGASSDAAAALLAGRKAWGVALNDAQLGEIAASLGTDVPFFLNGPCAIVRGTGTLLEPLPPLRTWAVIVTPLLRLQRKTAHLYQALNNKDMSAGSKVETAAMAIRMAQLPRPELLTNAFMRPLLKLEPSLAHLSAMMRGAGAPFVALSGSGGSHYTLLAVEEEARYVTARLRERLPTSIVVNMAPTRQLGLAIE